jgi:predicted Co/Zn/Cd cation transporter (cation efflux family)
MFVRSYVGVVVALILCTLCTYLLVSGHYDGAKRWIDGVLVALVAFVFIRIWLK